MSINDFQAALSWYQRVLQILYDNTDYLHLADIYRKMNRVQKELNSSDEANIYEILANEIDEQYGSAFTVVDDTLSEAQYKLENDRGLTGNQRARHLYTIGLCYMRKNEHTKTLENLLQAEGFCMTNRSTDSPSFHTSATLFDNLALVHLFLDEHRKVLTMWKRALDSSLSHL